MFTSASSPPASGPRRARPSLPLVISLLALVISMGGTSYAAVKINGNQIKNGTVANKALKGKTITGRKVKPDALRGKQIKESSLAQVPSAARADSAPPVGTAGGGLSGEYPNPQVADEAIVSSKLGTITRRSESTNIGAGNWGEATAYCRPGEQLISGGNDGDYGMRLIESKADGRFAWTVYVYNERPRDWTVTAHAYCLAP